MPSGQTTAKVPQPTPSRKAVVATCEPPSGAEFGILHARSADLDDAFAALAKQADEQNLTGVYSVRVVVQMNGFFIVYGTGIKAK